MKIDGENRHKQYRVAVIDYRDICKYLLAGPGCCNSASDLAADVDDDGDGEVSSKCGNSR